MEHSINSLELDGGRPGVVRIGVDMNERSSFIDKTLDFEKRSVILSSG